MWAVFRVEWEWIKIQRQHAESIVSSRLKDVPSSEHAVSQEEVVAALSIGDEVEGERGTDHRTNVSYSSGVYID